MKLNCSFQDIADSLGLRHSNSDLINAVSIDSRNPNRGKEVLFIAIVGPNNDGHRFIPDLIHEGLTHFVVHQDFKTEGLDAHFLKVENTLAGLQSIAKWHRERFDYPVLTITGSAGKTSVKEWLYHLLKENYNTIRSPKSYNSQVGVPLSILEMTEHHQLAIIEAGISKPDEMIKLKEMIQPTLGILTNIGEAHAHNFESKAQQEQEKLLLFDELNWWIDGRINLEGAPSISLSDRASIQNAQICWAFIKKFDPNRADEYKSSFIELENLALRLEVQQGINHNIIVNDSYNSDVNGLGIALDLAHSQPMKNLVLILSDLDTDQSSKKEIYSSTAEIINNYKVQRTIGIGVDVELLNGQIPNFTSFPSVAELPAEIIASISHSCILLKGARKFKFERIGRMLQEKHHDTVLEINLKALEHNLNVFRSKLNGTKIMCMVKAFGYGAGDLEVAKLMERQGVYALGVAYADEGIALRNAGIGLPIMVMNAEPAAFNGIIENDL
ncbi:MAG: alanine racemase, partial [Flavobacteriales bacterium]|nr:alanine racemase [Flavobacteriales bacterium]